MIDRERIKEILEDSLSEARRTDFVPAQDEELSELCRVYLAWLDAPASMLYYDSEYLAAKDLGLDDELRLHGKTVRLVEVK